MTQLYLYPAATHNKVVKFTPAAKGAACAGQPTLRFGCPLPRRYASPQGTNIVIKYSVLSFLLFSAQCFGEQLDYWSIDIPVPNEAMNIQKEKNSDFFTISTTFDLNISETEQVYELYDQFFSSMGWKNPIKGFSKPNIAVQGSWNSYSMSFTDEGLPRASYASIWKSTDIPAYGNVQLVLTSYNGGVFTGTVEFTITPEVDMSPIMELQQLMIGDPKNIFYLYQIIDVNPFELEKAINKQRPKDKSNVVVTNYFKILDQVAANFKEFGDTYVRDR